MEIGGIRWALTPSFGHLPCNWRLRVLVLLSLPARHEWGESRREGAIQKNNPPEPPPRSRRCEAPEPGYGRHRRRFTAAATSFREGADRNAEFSLAGKARLRTMPANERC